MNAQRLPHDIRTRLDRLPALFGGDGRVVFACLFGGLAKGEGTPLSDVDIAVYLDPVCDRRAAKLELAGALADALGTDAVDLVLLNDAPLSLVGRVLGARRVITDKQPFVRHAFESRTLREFFDFARREREILYRRFA